MHQQTITGSRTRWSARTFVLRALRRGLRRLGPLALVAAAACGGPTDEACHVVELSFGPEGPQVGFSSLALDVRDTSGASIRGATVEIEGNMNHAGMVPVFASAREDGAGVYRAELEFTMGGDWFLLVGIDTEDGHTHCEHVLRVPGVRSSEEGT